MNRKWIGLVTLVLAGAVLLCGCNLFDPARYVRETYEEPETEYGQYQEEEQSGYSQYDDDEQSGNGQSQNAGNIRPVEATIGNPAQVGEWVETKVYNSNEISERGTVYFRITEIIRDVPELQGDDGLEYCMLKYEVYFPENYKADTYGIYFSSISLGMVMTNIEDIREYGEYGPTGVRDISIYDYDMDLYPGDVYTGGVAVFAMVQGSAEYLLESSYYKSGSYDEKNKVAVYIQGT